MTIFGNRKKEKKTVANETFFNPFNVLVATENKNKLINTLVSFGVLNLNSVLNLNRM